MLLRRIQPALRITLVVWLLTAVIYPLMLWGMGQLIFPAQANGSLLTDAQGTVIGSSLIGQPFQSARYFWGRPSAIAYATDLADRQTGRSGNQHLGPTNPLLRDRIATAAQQWQATGLSEIPNDLLYSSASGLDPHISLAAAQAQIPRVAAARQRSPEAIATLIDCYRDRPVLGIIGGTGINVLQLNRALDRNDPAEGQTCPNR